MSITILGGQGRQNGYIASTIASGGTESSVADLAGYANYGLLIPVLASGTLTFKVSNLYAGTYYTVKSNDSATAFTLTDAATARAVESNDLKALAGYRYIKIVSTATQTEGAIEFIWTLKG